MKKNILHILFFGLSFLLPEINSYNLDQRYLINNNDTSKIPEKKNQITIPSSYPKKCGILNSQEYINCEVLHDFTPFFISYSLFIATILTSVILSKTTNTTFFNHYVNIFDKIQMSRGTIIFCSLYFIWWISMFIYSFLTVNKGEVIFRLGIWICLNMATVLLPVTRNSIWIILFKVSYDRIIHIHKFIATLCIVSVIVKLIVCIIYYDFLFLFIPYNSKTGGSPLGGTLSSLSMILIGILSVPYIRNKLFEVFYLSHKFFLFLAIGTGVWHYLLTLYYILPTFVLYLIDIICRFVNTKQALYSHLKIIGQDDKKTSSILITISLLKPVKTPPGSYFFICFREISSFEWHPLSLITQNHNNLTFCAKDMGVNSWTNKIKNMNENKTLENKLKDSVILLQGPYGHINIDYTNKKYKYLILMAGGIGITPILSILYDIHHNYKKYKHLKHVYLIWIFSHSSMVDGLKFLLLYLDKKIFTISVYSTYNNDDKIEDGEYYFEIINYRPNVSTLINKLYDDNKMTSSELGVSCCGPNSLSKDVIISCSKLNIDICNENF